MRVELRAEVGELRPGWDRLVAAQPLASPFLGSWWVDHCAAGRRVVLVCRDPGEADPAGGGDLVGGAAFELERFGTGRFRVQRVRCVGQGRLAPDHLDVIAAPGRADEVAAAVAAWLRSGDRLVDLDGLAADGALVRALGVAPIERVAAPYRVLSGDDPLAGLPGQLRSTIKRTGKRLAKAGWEPRRVPPEEAERALDTLLELHDSRWEDGSDFSGDWAQFRPAAAVGIARGDVVVHELRRVGPGPDGSDENAPDSIEAAEGAQDAVEVIASELELVAGDRVAFYQSGRRTDHDLRGSGSVLKAAVLAWAHDRSMTEFDLLRGDEPYKADWATDRRDVVRVRFGCGTRGRAAAAVANGVHRGAPAAHRGLARLFGEERATEWFRRVAGRLG